MENTSDIIKLYPLSHMQEGMLFHSLMDNQSNAYFEQIFFTINGKLDIELLEKSFNCLIDRHDIFRTNFVSEKVKQPVQVVFKQKKANIYFEDISDIDEVEKEKHIKNYIIKDRKKGFNLLKDMLVRLAVIKTKKNIFKVIWSHHHILLDGWCLGIVVKELMDIYIALKEEKELCLNKVYPYSDYINWLQKKDKGQAIKYWEEYLKGYEQKAVIPRSVNKKKDIKYDNRDYVFSVSEKDTGKLKQFANENEVTLNNVFQSIWGILLQKYNNTNDVVYGAVVSGRPSEIDGIESMVGLFINTVPVRINCNQNTSFIELVEEVKKASILNANNDYVPLADIQVNTYLKQELMDHIIAFENYPLSKEFGVWGDSQESKISITDIDIFEQTNYDFNVVVEMGSQLSIKLSYNSYMFEDSFIKSIEGHLKNIIDKVMDEPNIMVEDIEIITELEKKQILFEYNDTKAEYPKNKTIHQLFEEQVEKTPDNIAVSYEDKSLSYREINHRANMIARLLREKGIGPDDIVGILVERSIEMIVGILGVLKAGGAYLPIDTIYPQDRINYILEDSGTEFLLTQFSLRNDIEFNGESICLDDESLYYGDGSNLVNINNSTNLAYIIYTSGTTGKPKGSMIEHNNLVRLMFNDKFYFDFTDRDVWTMFHSVCFDFSVWEMYGALLYGGRLVLIPKWIAQDAGKYLEIIKKEKVTILNQTPSAFYNLMNEEVTLNEKELGIRYIVFGGEALNPIMLKQWRYKYPDTKLINMYGITETTVHVTFKEITNKEIEIGLSNIGKPIPTLTTYIMDKNMKLMPIGVPGELCVGGDGVGRGYLNRIELTQEKFINNPYLSKEKIYRSGDLARLMPNGDLEYLGRIDHQVKIRGFRIELGEIETNLLKYPSITEAVVLARKDGLGDNYLSAYIVVHNIDENGTEEVAFSNNKIRSFLKDNLPDYMVPAYFVEVEKIPLTTNGKVDRNSLPDPTMSIDLGIEYVAPSNDIEVKLVELWKEILGIQEVGVKHNFFDIGGHSLKATILVSRIKKELSVDISLREVFDYQTIEELGNRIKIANKAIYSPIQPLIIENHKGMSYAKYPISAAQKRLFVLWQLEGMTTTYNLPGVMLIEGNLDWKKFENSFRILIERQESLRTSFEMIENNYYQIVHKSKEFNIEYEEQNEKSLEALMKEFIRPFDLSQAPLLRIKLINQGGNKHLMLFDMHHIISDGVSVDIIIRELTSIYQDIELPELKIQYKDYSNWQKELLESKEIEKQEKYWLDVFKGEIPVLNVPTDYPRPSFQSFEGDKVLFKGEIELLEKLNSYISDKNCTLYMLLLTVYNVLLSKYSLQEDIIVGSPIAGRSHADLQNIIGMFVNTLGIRNFPSNNKKFDEFLDEVKQNTLSAFENQEYQFEQLVEKLEVRRDTSRNPLFDVMFSMQNMGNSEFKIPSLKFTNYHTNIGISKFDLTLTAEEKQEYLEFEFEYCSKIFKKETIQRMGEHYLNILRQIIQSPDILISEINLMSPNEFDLIKNNFNNTTSQYPSEKTLKELFEEQVQKHPQNIAIEFEDVQLTYEEINVRANQLARTLRKKGVQANSIVSIIANRSVNMIISILGTLKAGGAYMPIDPEYPEERVKYMMDDSGASILLTQKDICININFDGEILYLEDEEIYCDDTKNLDTINKSNDLAYLIYTSGSTGKSKGNLTTHYNISRVVKNTNYIDITQSDIILQLSNYAFDGSTFDIYGALLNGAKLVLIRKDTLQEIEQLSKVIYNKKISIFFVTTALFNTLVDLHIECFKNIRKVLFGGERVSVQHVRKALNYMGKDKILHVYGPTETTVFASYYPVNEIEENPITIPIGGPLANTKIYIFDKNMNQQPIGIPGELCISGDGLVKGYLNRPELDAEKFIKNPLNEDEIIYKTGDLARWLSEGNIEFIDRIDSQVKIRGFRIELGEIEYQLLLNKNINEAVVIAREDENARKYICAYIVAELELNISSIKENLAQELPKYMIPAYIMQLDKMPLNANGKIDKKVLPEPSKELNLSDEYVAPRNEVEEKMVEIWRQVLGIEKMGVKDDFFDNGGDSIKAAQVTSRLRQYDIYVEVKELFRHSNIAELSTCVKKEIKRVNQCSVIGEIEFTPIQNWFYSKVITDINHFNQAIMIHSENSFDENIVRKAFDKIIQHHDALRIIYKAENNKTTQFNRDVDVNLFDLELINLKGQDDYERKIEENANRLQAGISLTAGPLVKIGLYNTDEGDYLLIVIHHLVVDAVSWRIIMEDFTSAYKQISEGRTDVKLPEKTNSFKDWSDTVQQYSNSAEILDEIDYWNELEKKSIKPLPKEGSYTRNRIIDSETMSIELTKNETNDLLKNVNSAYKTEINDILLTALGMTIKSWTNEDNVLINLEGHGREDIVNDIDVTRTVGWFTSAYPVVLDMTKSYDVEQLIIATKHTMRRIPKKGVGYGILKYITLPENKTSIEFNLNPEISFNYLGQFDQDFNTDLFNISDVSCGESISPYTERMYSIDINGAITEGKLSVTLNYNKQEYSKDTISTIIGKYKSNLLKTIQHCIKINSYNKNQIKENSIGKLEQIKALDFNKTDLLEKFDFEIRKFEDKFLNDVLNSKMDKTYSLSGTQKYHLIEPELAGVVIEFNLGLDIKAFEKSIIDLLKTHEVLRSVIVEKNGKLMWEEYECPDKINIPILDLQDYSGISQKMLIDFIMSEYFFYREYKKYNTLQYRILLIRLSIDEYLLLMPFNHTIFDATSAEIVKRDILEYYELNKNNIKVSIKKNKCTLDYMNQVKKGPQGLSEQEILEIFNLNEAETELEKLNRSIEMKCNTQDCTWFNFDIPINLISEDDMNMPWKVSFALLNALCKQYFDTVKVPMRMVSNGRRLGDTSYYNNVGDFADHIPMLIDNEKCDVLGLANYVQDKINIAAKHNINFANLVFDEELEEKYSIIHPLIKNQLFNSPVLFNYQGKYEDEEIETFNNLLIGNNFDKYKNLIKEKKWVAFFVKYSVKAIKIIVALPFEVDEKKLTDFLESESKAIVDMLLSDI